MLLWWCHQLCPGSSPMATCPQCHVSHVCWLIIKVTMRSNWGLCTGLLAFILCLRKTTENLSLFLKALCNLIISDFNQKFIVLKFALVNSSVINVDCEEKLFLLLLLFVSINDMPDSRGLKVKNKSYFPSPLPSCQLPHYPLPT